MMSKKAHLNPVCEQDIYFELPAEAGATAGKCGKLVHWLYGFRPAAHAWEKHYARKMEEVGFRHGRGVPLAFWHPERDVSCVVHGDDFVTCGARKNLEWFEQVLRKRYPLKVHGIWGGECRGPQGR